jgi:hypothetical protein
MVCHHGEEADMSEEMCCTSTRESPAPICPRTGRATLPVDRATVQSHLQVGDAPRDALGFCDAPTCSIVYVSAAGRLIDKSELRTRMGIKEVNHPIPVCYCFGFSERQITKDVREHGRSTIREHIAGQVEAGNCRCTLTIRPVGAASGMSSALPRRRHAAGRAGAGSTG